MYSLFLALPLPLFWRLYVCHNISCFMPVGTCILRRDREFLPLLILVLDSSLGKHFSYLCCRRNRMITIVHAVRSIIDKNKSTRIETLRKICNIESVFSTTNFNAHFKAHTSSLHVALCKFYLRLYSAAANWRLRLI